MTTRKRRTPIEPPEPTAEELAAVLRVLQGRTEPIERLELARQASLNERTTRKAVRTLVMRGQLIITLNDGYRIVEDRGLVRREVRSLRHRAKEILERALALERKLDDPRAIQETLFDEGPEV